MKRKFSVPSHTLLDFNNDIIDFNCLTDSISQTSSSSPGSSGLGPHGASFESGANGGSGEFYGQLVKSSKQ